MKLPGLQYSDMANKAIIWFKKYLKVKLAFCKIDKEIKTCNSLILHQYIKFKEYIIDSKYTTKKTCLVAI